MTTHPARSRRTAAVAALCGIAAIAAAVSAALSPAAAAGRPQHRPGPAAASVPVVISCTGHAQIRPQQHLIESARTAAAIERTERHRGGVGLVAPRCSGTIRRIER